jgi:hypothetical protein
MKSGKVRDTFLLLPSKLLEKFLRYRPPEILVREYAQGFSVCSDVVRRKIAAASRISV